MPAPAYVNALRRSGGLALVLAITLLACASLAIAGSTSSHVQAATAHRIVRLAQRELARHVHEVPDGSNNSRGIARYRSATVGAMRGAPWCAYFVSYIAKRAGVPIGWQGEGMGYVPYIRDWARKTHRWRHTPKPGYLLTFPQHVGIVEHVYANHTFTSIEGNTSNAVLRRYHRWSEPMGYVKLAAGGAIEAPVAPHPAPTQPKGQKLEPRIRVYPATQAAVGQRLDFSAQDSSGAITKYSWDWDGDGKWDDHTAQASHAWQQAGTYVVKLQVSDAQHHHRSTTARITVHANQPPDASIQLSDDSVHVGEQVRMDASRSSDADGHVAKYEWDYTGDGNYVAGGSQASHAYDEPGTYVARVRVTDDSGNTAEASAAVEVDAYAPPVASVSCDRTEVTAGQTLHCSSDDSHSPYRVSHHDWDIQSDGSYDLHGTSVGFSYPHPGDYTLHLRVTDVNGNSDDADLAVQVDDVPPRARITPPATLKTNIPLTFDAGGSTDSDGRVTGYEWDTGSGYQPGARTLTTTFTTAGPKTVRLRVTDDGGQTNETSYSFTLANTAPAARIVLPATATVNTPLTFDGSTSSDGDGTVLRYDWDLNGDGAYETTGASPTFTYSTTGTRTIKLKVTDDLGATNVTTALLTVRSAPLTGAIGPLSID